MQKKKINTNYRRIARRIDVNKEYKKLRNYIRRNRISLRLNSLKKNKKIFTKFFKLKNFKLRSKRYWKVINFLKSITKYDRVLKKRIKLYKRIYPTFQLRRRWWNLCQVKRWKRLWTWIKEKKTWFRMPSPFFVVIKMKQSKFFKQLCNFSRLQQKKVPGMYIKRNYPAFHQFSNVKSKFGRPRVWFGQIFRYNLYKYRIVSKFLVNPIHHTKLSRKSHIWRHLKLNTAKWVLWARYAPDVEFSQNARVLAYRKRRNLMQFFFSRYLYHLKRNLKRFISLLFFKKKIFLYIRNKRWFKTYLNPSKKLIRLMNLTVRKKKKEKQARRAYQLKRLFYKKKIKRIFLRLFKKFFIKSFFIRLIRFISNKFNLFFLHFWKFKFVSSFLSFLKKKKTSYGFFFYYYFNNVNTVARLVHSLKIKKMLVNFFDTDIYISDKGRTEIMNFLYNFKRYYENLHEFNKRFFTKEQYFQKKWEKRKKFLHELFYERQKYFRELFIEKRDKFAENKIYFLKLRKVKSNFYITLTRNNHEVITTQSTGRVMQVKKRRVKMDTSNVLFMMNTIIQKIKDLRIKRIDLYINSKIDRYIHNVVWALDKDTRLKLHRVIYSKPMPHHLGQRKQKKRRL